MRMSVKQGNVTKFFYGFFQPVRSKSLQSIVHGQIALGDVPRGQYVYIGPVNVELAEGDFLDVNGQKYLLARVETYYAGGKPLYVWGLCTQKGGADTWGYHY